MGCVRVEECTSWTSGRRTPATRRQHKETNPQTDNWKLFAHIANQQQKHCTHQQYHHKYVLLSNSFFLTVVIEYNITVFNGFINALKTCQIYITVFLLLQYILQRECNVWPIVLWLRAVCIQTHISRF